MTMLELAIRYANRCGASPGYAEQLRVLTKRLPWQVRDLTPDTIDAYLTDALRHLAASTVGNHRRMLKTLLDFAASERLVDASIVRRLRRVKVPRPNPTAWSHDQIRSLLAVASQMPGRTKGCELKILMPAWILTAYATGLRLNDLLALRHDSLRGSRIIVSQQKTSEPHVVQLDDPALEAIRRLPRKGPLIFGDLVGRSRILVAMRKLVKLSEASGSTKYLRRSGATYVEAEGKDATRHLGHKSPGMKTYYVDRLLLAELRRETVSPPSIQLADSA